MMKLTLHVWRQKSGASEGRFVQYDANDVSPDMSFLEMLDVVNEDLTCLLLTILRLNRSRSLVLCQCQGRIV